MWEIRATLDRNLFRLSLIAIFVGVVTGFGALGFRGLIGFIHNLFFLGRISYVYDANTHTPGSPWGFFVILVPVVGGPIVTLLVTKFAPEARGHGVPEVMDAICYSKGRIRPVAAGGLATHHSGRRRHVVVTRDNDVIGVLRTTI